MADDYSIIGKCWYAVYFGATELEAIDNYRAAHLEATVNLHDVDVLDLMFEEFMKWEPPSLFPKPNSKPWNNFQKGRYRRREMIRLDCARANAKLPPSAFRKMTDYTDDELRAAADPLNPKNNCPKPKPKEETET